MIRRLFFYMFKNAQPEASNVTGVGFLYVGEEITINYTYSDYENNPEKL